jgi:acyl-homoserine lactone acylase PvdQ
MPPVFMAGNAPAVSPVAALHPDTATRALLETARRLQAANVPLNVPWGVVHRHRRGAVNLPLDGGGESLAPNVGPLGSDNTITAVFGSSYRMLVELGNGPVRAWSCAPYGNSDDPASPHFADQMPLAAKREYRRVPFSRHEVEAEATSRKTLSWPETP